MIILSKIVAEYVKIMNRPREMLLLGAAPNASTIPRQIDANMTTRAVADGTMNVIRKSTMMIPTRIREYDVPIKDMTEYARRRARPVSTATEPKMIAPNKNHGVSRENPLNAVSKFTAPVIQ